MPQIFSDNTPGFFSSEKEACRPNSGWVYIGVGLAAVIYVVIALFDLAFRPPVAQIALQEGSAALLLCLSFFICTRRPTVAAFLSLSVVFLDLGLSHVLMQRLDLPSLCAVPALVIAAGMLFGARGAFLAALTGGFGMPLAVYASGGWSHDLSGFELAVDGNALLIFEGAVFGTAILVIAIMRSYYAVLRDTEQMRRRYEELFSNAPDGLVSLDENGCIVDVNPAAGKIFGLSPAQLKRMPFSEVLDCAGAKQRPDFSTASAGLPATVELRPALGSCRVLEIAARSLSGPEPLMLLVIRDGTRKRVMDERLGHAQRLESVGRLAGGVAHDFNNLLTVVQGNAEMLREHADPEVRGQVRDILEAGARCALLTRQLLAFARREVHHPTVLDLGKVVFDMQRLLERVCGEQHRIVLRSGSLVCVRADITQIEQVLVNLVSNARDAMPQGGAVELDVRALSGEEARHLGSTLPEPSQALLQVTDHGVGMSPAVKGRLFEPFFTTKPRGKGTGLGLASVHGVIAQNKGAIWVDTALGRGTSFRIFFALERTAVASPAGEAPHVSPPGGSEHLLVVEDEIHVRTLSCHILARAGYRVSEAEHAEAAFAVLRAHPDISLVVSDVRMPGLSGLDMAARMHLERPSLPVLFMSGHANLELGSHAELSDDNLIRKPFTAEEFLGRVRRRLERSRKDRRLDVREASEPAGLG